jgi:hypothetical protein
MPLPKPASLVIACQSIGPFVDVPLLRRLPDNSLELLPAAPAVPIDKALKRLAKLDDEYDLHTIPGILDVLKRGCWDAGYSLGMSPAELLDDTQITTIDDLAKQIRIGSIKA